MKNFLLISLITGISACSFVKLDPQAQSVGLAQDKNSVGKCQFIGDTNVSVWSKADTFQSQSSVDDQLHTLARNQAATMGGNMVLPKSPITDGQRTYGVYKCPTESSVTN